MALSITAANVVPTNPTRAKRAVIAAGVTITAGEVLAFDSDGKAVECDANSGTALTRVPIGIAVSGGSPGQPVFYVDNDDTLTIGATVANGVPYFTSATAGAIEELTSQASCYTALLGYGVGTTQLQLAISGGVYLATDPTP